MGIVRENANFRGSETDYVDKKKMSVGGKKLAVQKRKEKRKHWFLAEYLENI